MPLFQLLLLAAAAVIAALGLGKISVAARAWMRRPRTWAVLLSLALATAGASALVRSERSAGTGTAVSRGFPKAFHFTWQSWEGGGERQGGSALYFVGNVVFYFSAWLLAGAAGALVRAAGGTGHHRE